MTTHEPGWCTSTHELDQPEEPVHSTTVAQRGEAEVRLVQFGDSYRVHINTGSKHAFVDADTVDELAKVVAAFGTDPWLSSALRKAYRTWEKAVIEEGLPDLVTSPLFELSPKWVQRMAERKGLVSADRARPGWAQ